MPIYEYDCPGCGRTFEKRVPMSQADAIECPNCGSKYPQRKLSRIAIKGHVSVSSAPAPAPGGG